MAQPSLFRPSDAGPQPKPMEDEVVSLRLLVTVKAAPNPSERHGETVCVAGLSVDLSRPGWIRLYPINYRELTTDERFRKYDIVAVDARPAHADQRRESWKPILSTMIHLRHLRPWKPRCEWLDAVIKDSMCHLNDG